MRHSTSAGIGLGCDLVTISRIGRLLSDYPDRFRAYAFSAAERRYCDQQAVPAQHYAARWAVKEAYIKATGVSGASPDLTSIELSSDTPPRLALSGDGSELLARSGAGGDSLEESSVAVSLAHERDADLALGFVLIVG